MVAGHLGQAVDPKPGFYAGQRLRGLGGCEMSDWRAPDGDLMLLLHRVAAASD